MSNEKITIFYEPFVIGYHETLVYTFTDASGQQQTYIATAWPTNPQSINPFTFSQAANAVANGTPSDWGTLGTTVGPISSFSQEDIARLLGTNPSVIVASGNDLSRQWDAIKQAEQQIANQDLPYSPTSQNSNSVASAALTAAGIPLPANNGFFTPAADNLLNFPPIINSTVINQDGSITMQFPGGTAATVAFNQAGNTYTISTANLNGNTSVINYDASGSVTSVTTHTLNSDGSYNNSTASANGTATSTDYNSNDQITSTTINNPDNSRSTTTYDLVNHTSTQTNTSPNGPTLSTTYDANMNAISSTTTQQDGSHTTETFDPATGNTSVINYDANQNVMNVTTRTDNGGGNYNISTTDANGTSTSADYNSNGQITSNTTTDAAGNWTNTTYNPDNRSSTVESYDAASGTYKYTSTDAAGNMTSSDVNYDPKISCLAVNAPIQQLVPMCNDGDDDAVTEGEYGVIYLPPTDPIVIDLTGNGIQTVGLSAGIRFDQNGSGTKQGTGWIAPGNGFLVLDRNGNGVIDNGSELFGNNTPLYDAAGNFTGYAANGQAALAALDTNGDGVVNNLDANFAQLKVWQDTNGDGICQPGELQTLAQLGITGINVGGMVGSGMLGTQLPNGNQISATGTYTRADGTTGTIADVNLALDPLNRSFGDTVPVTAGARALPTMQGSGTVRDLNQAASLQTAQGAALFADLTAFRSATTGFAQHAEADTLLQDWAATSTQQTSARLAAAQGQTLHYYTFDPTGYFDQAASDSLTRMITPMINVMECFGGVNITSLNGVSSSTGDVYVPLSSDQATLIEQRYKSLQDSIYGALVMQTRLKPFLDSIGLNLTTGTGLQYDFTALNARIAAMQASDPQSALIDLVELQRYAGTQLKSMGWSALPQILDTLHALNGSPLLNDAMNLLMLDKQTALMNASSLDIGSSFPGFDILLRCNGDVTNEVVTIDTADGKEYIYGGNGTDKIFGGGAVSNTIYAGDGNIAVQLNGNGSSASTVYGGAGSDTIYGGGGTDVIYAGDGGTANAATQVYAGVGTSTIYGGAGVDQLYGGNYDGSSSDTIIAGSGTTTLTGGNGTDVMYGGSGNDTLIAGTGSDTLYGGSGTDLLQGSSGVNLQRGGSGDTLFVAGSGNETIRGGIGNNIYEFDVGFGTVELQNTQSTDVFRFGAGIGVTDLNFSATLGSDGKPALLIKCSGGGQITIDGGLDGAISNFAFDGGVLSLDQLMAQANTTPVTVAGTNSNLIFSANGHDSLVGGSSTGSGQAPGNDTIYAWNGNDTLVAGSGVATLVGESGNDTFVVNNSADVVQAHSTGNTVISSVSYSLADQAQSVQNLTLTGTADLTATGNNLDNVITANSGNDMLAGGAGNDTLVGGTGLDTFAMGLNMGSDSVIDTSAQGGIVQLDSGLSLSDLTATQQGNDLLLQIVGSTDSMLIKDYYSNPQTAWMIKDSSGNTTTPQNLLDANAAAPMSLNMAQLESNFAAQVKAGIAYGLGLNGYSLQADGSYWLGNNPPTYDQYQTSGMFTLGADLNVQHNISYFDGSVASYNTQESWMQAVNQFFIGTSVAIQETKISSLSPVIDATSTFSKNSYIGNMWAQASWNYSYNAPSTNTYTVPVTDSQGKVIGLDQQVIALTSSTYELQARITGPILSGTVGIGQVAQFVPIPIYNVQQNTSDVIQQIYVGDGNHTVNGGTVGPYGVQTTVVNAGSGNDVINNAGFVYTGTGNDTVVGAETVYCGTGNNEILNAGTAYGGTGNDTMIGGGTLTAGMGNDLLIGGNTMIAGSGSDQIYAGQGAATIQIDPTTASTDLIGGAGNSDPTRLLNAFYQSMGIHDWQIRYQSAGVSMYYLNTESGSGYFDAQTAVQKLNAWGWSGMTLQDALNYGYTVEIYNPQYFLGCERTEHPDNDPAYQRPAGIGHFAVHIRRRHHAQHGTDDRHGTGRTEL